MNKEELTARIEAYLNGEMTEEQRARFQQRIATDRDLAAEVALYRNLDIALADEGALALQRQTDALGDEFFGTSTGQATKPPPFRIYRRAWAIAASVLLLVVSGWLWWSARTATALSGPELYAAYYEAPDFSNTVRGDDPRADDYTRAVEAYQVSDFISAERLFKNHVNSQPADIRAAFGLASVYLAQQPPKLNEAKRYFQAVVEQGESLLVDKSKWYLSLIYLKEENKPAAQSLLRELLASADQQLALRAEALLEDL